MEGAYYIAFDLVTSGYKAWVFPARGLVFVAGGLLLAFFPGVLPVPWPWTRQGIQAFGWIFAAFAVLWTGFSFWSTHSEYRHLADSLAAGRYQTVEGIVENYAGNEEDEKFSVNNVWFEYSDNRVTSAFNNVAALGGPVRPGLHVRIAHVDGKIVRLEIRR
jgi:hypothetical protein